MPKESPDELPSITNFIGFAEGFMKTEYPNVTFFCYDLTANTLDKAAGVKNLARALGFTQDGRNPSIPENNLVQKPAVMVACEMYGDDNSFKKLKNAANNLYLAGQGLFREFAADIYGNIIPDKPYKSYIYKADGTDGAFPGAGEVMLKYAQNIDTVSFPQFRLRILEI